MRRRGQTTLLVLALLLPAAALGLLGLAFLGARARGEHAQRLADVAALRAARGLPQSGTPGAELTVQRHGSGWRVTARLRPTALRALGLGPLDFTPAASAIARATITADGRPGAILVG